MELEHSPGPKGSFWVLAGRERVVPLEPAFGLDFQVSPAPLLDSQCLLATFQLLSYDLSLLPPWLNALSNGEQRLLQPPIAQSIGLPLLAPKISSVPQAQILTLMDGLM